MAGRIAGKVALVTGAGSGIGRAAAQSLAREGARVIATDVSAPGLEETAAGAAGIRTLTHDTADEAAWDAVIASIRATEGRLDAVVNNAGVSGGRVPLLETTAEQWRRVHSVNVEGVFHGLRLGALMMRDQGTGGSIVNISSIYGIVGAAGSVNYCASKGAVRLMTKAAAVELGPLGIRVNSVHPGFIETNMTAPFLGEPGVRDALIRKTPLGRAGAPKDIADAILFLVSDDSAFVTGTELVVDGGWTAQ